MVVDPKFACLNQSAIYYFLLRLCLLVKSWPQLEAVFACADIHCHPWNDGIQAPPGGACIIPSAKQAVPATVGKTCSHCCKQGGAQGVDAAVRLHACMVTVRLYSVYIHGSWTMDRPWTMVHGPWSMVHGPWSWDAQVYAMVYAMAYAMACAMAKFRDRGQWTMILQQ